MPNEFIKLMKRLLVTPHYVNYKAVGLLRQMRKHEHYIFKIIKSKQKKTVIAVISALTYFNNNRRSAFAVNCNK